MTAKAIKKQLDTYVPMLSGSQLELLLNMVKNILNVDSTEKRISIKQYNKELKEAEKRVAKGNYHTHAEVEKILNKRWGI